MKVFGDAPDRMICPNNITINNKDTSIQSLTNSSIEENDFVFIESTDGVHYKDGGAAIDFDYFMNNHTNVWLSIDSFPYTLMNSSERPALALQNKLLYLTNEMPSKIFNVSNIAAQANVTIHNPFNDIYSCASIIERNNKAFIISTPADFIKNIDINVKMFYELLMYVYFNTYIKSEPINDWIADVMPDYVVVNNMLTVKDNFCSSSEYYNLVGLDASEINLIDVEITPNNIKFAGLSNNYVLFKKDVSGSNAQYADPQKPAGSISVFTSRQNIIYYKNFIYKIEDDVTNKINYQFIDDEIVVTIKPFISTANNINVTQEVTLPSSMIQVVNGKETALTNVNLYIVCKDNILNLINKDTYTNINGIIIAELQITQSANETKIYDMRQRGGGLPEDSTIPCQSLLDVGNINGISYRKAGAEIITLPKRLEPYKDIITSTVMKHIVAEEFPIILFEDKE
jgi:hypothetical protein